MKQKRAPKAPPGMDRVPATETFFQPRVVGGKLAPHKHQQIEDRLALIAERRASSFVTRAIEHAAELPQEIDAEKEREAREAVRDFRRRAEYVWLDRLSDADQERILTLVFNRCMGLVPQSTYGEAIRKARAVAVGPDYRDWSDTRPKFDDGDGRRLPYGF